MSKLTKYHNSKRNASDFSNKNIINQNQTHSANTHPLHLEHMTFLERDSFFEVPR